MGIGVLGDSAVRDRGIVEELSALLQAPVADHGVVYRSNLFDDSRVCLCQLSYCEKKSSASLDRSMPKHTR